MFGTNNKSKFIALLGFISLMMTGVNANARSLYENGKIHPKDATIAVRSAIVAGGSVDILEGTTGSSVRGVNDFNGNKLTNRRNFVIDGLTVNFGVAVDGTSPANVNYTSAFPAALKTANLIILQDNKQVRKISLAVINEMKSTDQRFLEFGGFGWLAANVTTQIEFEFGAGTDLGVAAGSTGYVEVLFKGFETEIK